MNDYPANWRDIAHRIKTNANWKCERCNHDHDVESSHVLTVHHLDGDKANCEDWNLAALCQRCHLHIQAKVVFNQDYYFPHTPWMRRHVAAYNKWAFLNGKPPLTLLPEAETASK
jgi:hypothetical protein